MSYLLWFDDTKKSAAQKVAEAAAVYAERFGRRPTVVLVNELDIVEVEGMAVRPVGYIRRHNFWVGHERPEGTQP